MPRYQIGRLWTGGEASYLELLCFASIRRAGAKPVVYAYDDAPALPDWIERRDAAAILPPGAAPEDLREDLFRYRLLAAAPGFVWVGAGMCLLRPPEPAEGWLLARESARFICADLLAMPAESAALRRLIAQAEASCAAGEAEWGELGAAALTASLDETGEAGRALPPEATHPVPFAERGRLLARRETLDGLIRPETLAVNIYAPELRRMLADSPGGMPKYWSPLGSLLRANGIGPRDAPIPEAPPIPPEERGWSPAPQPAPAIAPEAAKSGAARAGETKPARVVIVTTMKNEGPFILEWIAYHRAIGITDFLVYTNDCDDGTDAFHDLLARKGIVAEHRDNPYREFTNLRPQFAALKDAWSRPVVREADWIVPMDVDEFINIHVGEGRFQDLLDAVPGVNAISMIWRLFGNGFVSAYEDRFVTEQFLHCAHERANKPYHAWGFKTAFRNNGIFSQLSVHRPVKADPARADEVRWITGAGKPLAPGYIRNGWRATPATAGYGLVALNHYSLRSSESYLVKRDRGRVNHVDRDQGLAYWFRMNHNAVAERSILKRLPAAKAEFAKLMADPEIAAAHHAAVAFHRAKIADLRTRPEYAALYETVNSEKMAAVSRILKRFDNALFSEGPHAIPEEIMNALPGAPVDLTPHPAPGVD